MEQWMRGGRDLAQWDTNPSKPDDTRSTSAFDAVNSRLIILKFAALREFVCFYKNRRGNRVGMTANFGPSRLT